jgi:hypothetical protein
VTSSNRRAQEARVEAVTSSNKRKGKPGKLTMPILEFESGSDPMLLRSEMLSLSEDNKVIGGVDTGTGLGSDVIRLYWRDRVAVLQGHTLLKTWVATFDPKAAKRMP